MGAFVNMAVHDSEEQRAVAYLRTPEAIRERCHRIVEAGVDGELAHFTVHLDRLGDAVERTVAVTRARYPDLQLPPHSRWNHFQAGGIDRHARFVEVLSGETPRERARSAVDLVVTSVLLDAGAGDRWRYREPSTGAVHARSEGLAVASFDAFASGAFSGRPETPWRADAAGLSAFSEGTLAEAFQVDENNPLAGLAGRAALLRRLGEQLEAAPRWFGEADPRIGGLVDAAVAESDGGRLPAGRLLGIVLEALGPIWPGRLELGGQNLGDVWPHPRAGGEGPGAGLVPFHKLSQWLTYSLLEPLDEAGLEITQLEALTGLAEYRNGGLFVDTGVLALRDEAAFERDHRPGDELVVEWRALTVGLLDRLAAEVRRAFGRSEAEMPLAHVLEGGSWAAGRMVAEERRPGGGPPLRIVSDGTVF
jgi:hypothetical protein